MARKSIIFISIALLLIFGNAHPVPDEGYQRLVKIPAASSQEYFFGGETESAARTKGSKDEHNKPFTPGHRDPYDRKVDPIRDNLEPLPYRNGDGATVMGPRNRDRERQNPDIVRPPSTDHGTLSNMRWSFADSHTRIEVFAILFFSHIGSLSCIRLLY